MGIMHNAPCIQEYRRHLQRLGCPARMVGSRVRELAEHYYDLKVTAMEGGLTELAAEEQAAKLLGEPRRLAEDLVWVIRRSSWSGRHPVLTFCLLPVVTFLLSWLIADALCFAPVWLWLSASEWRVLTGDSGSGIELIRALAKIGYCGAVAGTAMLFCWLTQRTASGRTWALITCAICSLNSYMFYFRFDPHNLTVGYHFSSSLQDLTGPLICLSICALFLSRHRILSRWNKQETSVAG